MRALILAVILVLVVGTVPGSFGSNSDTASSAPASSIQ